MSYAIFVHLSAFLLTSCWRKPNPNKLEMKEEEDNEEENKKLLN
jgi:hypothetical protein